MDDLHCLTLQQEGEAAYSEASGGGAVRYFICLGVTNRETPSVTLWGENFGTAPLPHSILGDGVLGTAAVHCGRCSFSVALAHVSLTFTDTAPLGHRLNTVDKMVNKVLIYLPPPAPLPWLG